MYDRIGNDLDAFSSKLWRAQADYQRARALGDSERVCQFRTQIDAIMVERDLLIRRLGAAAATQLHTDAA